ncbi:hypothetical protein [Dyadobacter tibetensis]|uniref:hypothetical protein n=1 Tax=Dyadobacter tibetensis TaxID=1211851 RepID=UPI00046F8460|nr:hypothetical protein [Dyadobacter tibetensis]
MELLLNKINMVRIGCLFFVLLLSATAYAQRHSNDDMKRIQDAKVAIITNRLNLTAEQSAAFWPVYNEYSQKKRQIHREQRKIFGEKRAEGLDDREALNNLKEVQELKQRELDLEKEYQQNFLKVISASQVAELYKAERTFNEMLIQRLKHNRENKPNN